MWLAGQKFVDQKSKGDLQINECSFTPANLELRASSDWSLLRVDIWSGEEISDQIVLASSHHIDQIDRDGILVLVQETNDVVSHIT